MRPGKGEIDLHVRIPAVYRAHLEEYRRERNLTLTGALAQLLRRALEDAARESATRSKVKHVRPGMTQEASLASLVAIEELRLALEEVLSGMDHLSRETLQAKASLAAEDRLNAVRRAIEEFRR